MDLEVLVTTMHQSDMKKYSEMNIQTAAVIANQADKNAYAEMKIDGHTVKMVTTDTRGLSRNRNIALVYSSSEYIVFSDDDVIFVDDYEKLIEEEFAKHSDAEAIKFYVENIDTVRPLSWKCPATFAKATRRNISSAGVLALVIRSDVLRKLNLFFHESFGAGTENFCGEDTIFLQRMINEGVNFYVSPVKIAEIDQSESSWFTAYDRKYFETAGMVLKTIYPRMAHFIVIRSAYRFSKRKKCNMKFVDILKSYYRGMGKK